MILIIFPIPQPVFRKVSVISSSIHSWLNLANVSDGRVKCSAIEPNPTNTRHVVFPKLESLGPIDNLLHVGIVHGQNDIGSESCRSRPSLGGSISVASRSLIWCHGVDFGQACYHRWMCTLVLIVWKRRRGDHNCQKPVKAKCVYGF